VCGTTPRTARVTASRAKAAEKKRKKRSRVCRQNFRKNSDATAEARTIAPRRKLFMALIPDPR